MQKRMVDGVYHWKNTWVYTSYPIVWGGHHAHAMSSKQLIICMSYRIELPIVLLMS